MGPKVLWQHEEELRPDRNLSLSDAIKPRPPLRASVRNNFRSEAQSGSLMVPYETSDRRDTRIRLFSSSLFLMAIS